MRVLVTGANGFIGKNLVLRLCEETDTEVLFFVRGDSYAHLQAALVLADAVIHLAGENRPASPDDYETVNVGLTRQICDGLRNLAKSTPLLLASSTHAELDTPYGRSKLAAEQVVAQLASDIGNPVAIYRLPSVFGKWCKPNYNSVVATFCHNKANDLPVHINDVNARISLVYVDDVVNVFLSLLASPWTGQVRPVVQPEYSITLGELSAQIEAFKNCRGNLLSERVGTGLTRALYATYVSYLPKEKFAYEVPAYGDERGVFVEMLKTPDAGQFSFFTAHPGITRGGHYHNTKTEKFLVIKGKARFDFRHMLTNEVYHLETDGAKPQVVDTVPGWTHDITNVGEEEMVVMLWANEIFDRANPDTITSKV
ncbi:UDP-2-acetamido-2,6-beta-L-arabino-hexul-4-ose reductase [Shewanella sp.]|uniref:UDP-2-acetamido-2,6-beta-L-arabino-hexul-4-ose reductase n=1 Tax=Shewanella sp. TaxID=50422 RepID=UPI004047BDAD